VARFHLADRFAFTLAPWLIVAINFAIEFVLAATFGDQGKTQFPAYNIVAIYISFAFSGAWTLFKSLPFALSVGVSRRSYFAGTVLLALGLSAANAVLLASLQSLERVSDGWGAGLHFFRVAYFLNGPWALTWLTSFVGLALMFLYGMWWGLVFRRWSGFGLYTFGTAQAAAALIAVIVISKAGAWHAFANSFVNLSAIGLTGLMAALAVVLTVGGLATVRRVTV
jgi:hypothetical protein